MIESAVRLQRAQEKRAEARALAERREAMNRQWRMLWQISEEGRERSQRLARAEMEDGRLAARLMDMEVRAWEARREAQRRWWPLFLGVLTGLPVGLFILSLLDI